MTIKIPILLIGSVSFASSSFQSCHVGFVLFDSGHEILHKQSDIPINGWSFECRVYAEVTTLSFLAILSSICDVGYFVLRVTLVFLLF